MSFFKNSVEKIKNTETPNKESEWVWVDGYKVVRSNMKAYINDFQFERGGTYEIAPKESIEFGKTGFHFYEDKNYICNDFSVGYRIFKVKALVRENRTHYASKKQVAAKIIFGDEVDFKEYQDIFYKIPFIKDEESYQNFLEHMNIMTYDDYITMIAAKKLSNRTNLKQNFCLVLAEDLKRKLKSQGVFNRNFEKEIENMIAIYDETTLSKEMAVYFMVRRTFFN